MSQFNSNSSITTLDLSYRNILLIAAPVLIANLAMPLQGAIDVAVVGHFPKEYNLAGLGIASQLWLLILVSFNFLQYASSGLASQALGKQTATGVFSPELAHILYRSIGLAVILSSILWILKPFLVNLGLDFLGAQPNSRVAAKTYIDIRFVGIIFEMINYAFIGWFAGQGKTKQMMMVQIFISAINIILTLSFAFIFDLGLKGVALGTVIGYALGFLIATLLARQHIRHMSLKTKATTPPQSSDIKTDFDLQTFKTIFTLDKMHELFSLNKDIFIRTIILTLSFAWITRLSAQQGDLVMATNAILLQVLSISAFALDGVAVAAESLTGQAIAYRENKHFKLVVKRTGFTILILAITLSLIWLLVLPTFLNIMTDLESVKSLALDYRYIAALLPLVGAGAYWLDGVMFGLTAGSKIRQVAVVVALVFFPLTWSVYENYGSEYAMPVIWFSIYWLLLSRFVIAAMILWFNQNTLIKAVKTE